jgi:hypothetical protein
MFFIAAQIALEKLDHGGVRVLLRGLAAVNVLMLVTAISLYIVIVYFPAYRSLIFGANHVPYAWFAAGEGSQLMRMGLPMTSPNHLGFYFGLMSVLFLLLAIANHPKQARRTAYSILVAMNLVGLAATFSRSSMVMVVVAVSSSFVLVPGLRNAKMFMRGMYVMLALAAAVLSGLVLVELISGGFVTQWLNLNVKLQEPSLIGHWQSLVDAYDNFDRYYLYGYPRGTVGPRSLLFYVNERFNVENSVLSALYDFGLIGAAVFFLGYYLMLSSGYRSRLQLAATTGFLVCIQFLPYLFEPVILSLFVFVYLLIGQLDRLGYLHGLQGPRGDRSVAVHRLRAAGSPGRMAGSLAR